MAAELGGCLARAGTEGDLKGVQGGCRTARHTSAMGRVAVLTQARLSAYTAWGGGMKGREDGGTVVRGGGCMKGV